MKFGVFLPTYGKVSFQFVIEVALAAEKLGFDSVWVGDHLVNPDWQTVPVGGEADKPETLDPFPSLAAVAMITKRVKLGTCVTPLPCRQTPMHLAKTVATLDIISGGRVILGAGAGWYEREFLTYGQCWDEYRVRYEKMREGVEIIKKMWTETPTSYSGQYYSFRDAILLPKPIQEPYPPIWFGGNSMNIIRVTASLGDGWVPFAIRPETYRERLGALKAHAWEAGRGSAEIVPAYSTHVHVSENYDEVRNTIETKLKMWYFGSSVDVGKLESRLAREKEIERYCILGSPDNCISRIEEYANAGVTHFVLHPLPFDNAPDLLRVFADKITPYFRQ